MAGVHWNEKNLPNPETTTGAQAKADQALAAAKAYTDQNKVTSLPWGSITGKPETATRWPTWNEVSGKPETATRWPSWDEVTGKPSSMGVKVGMRHGTVKHGEQIPLPPGFTQEQCHWMVSLGYGYDRDIKGVRCSVDANRVVTAQYNTWQMKGQPLWVGTHANYIIIGVK